MSGWDYAVERLTMDSGSDPDAALAEALRSLGEDGWELVSCFPQARYEERSPIHELPSDEPGSNPYDAVWQTPTGPTFIAVFKRPT